MPAAKLERIELRIDTSLIACIYSTLPQEVKFVRLPLVYKCKQNQLMHFWDEDGKEYQLFAHFKGRLGL